MIIILISVNQSRKIFIFIFSWMNWSHFVENFPSLKAQITNRIL